MKKFVKGDNVYLIWIDDPAYPHWLIFSTLLEATSFIGEGEIWESNLKSLGVHRVESVVVKVS